MLEAIIAAERPERLRKAAAPAAVLRAAPVYPCCWCCVSTVRALLQIWPRAVAMHDDTAPLPTELAVVAAGTLLSRGRNVRLPEAVQGADCGWPDTALRTAGAVETAIAGIEICGIAIGTTGGRLDDLFSVSKFRQTR